MKFSVIIPVFNTKDQLLKNCVSSVLHQSYSNFEIIIIDDGSTSIETKNVLNLISLEDKRIKVYTISNHGVSYARNYGTSLASGNYVVYVDSDDEIAYDFLQVASHILSERSLDLLLFQVTFDKEKLLENSAELFEDKNLKYKLLNYYLSFCDKDFQSHDKWLNRGPVARAIRTDIALKNKFDESIHFGEDVLWNLKLLNNIKTVGFIKKATYFYRKNENSTTVRYHKDFDNDLSLLVQKIKESLKDNLEDENIKMSFSLAAFEYYRIFLKLDLFHSENSSSFHERYKTLKDASNKLMKNTEINQASYSFFDWKVKIKLFLMKKHLYLLLYFIERR